MKAKVLFALLAALASTPARADDFYKDKVISIVTSTGAGGSYDTMARLFSRHMGRFIPGRPTLVVRNMPGGGNVIATNYMFNITAKDGLTLGSVHNAMPLNQVLGGSGIAYESDKFNWLGSTGPDNSVILVRSDSPIRNIQDAMQSEVNLGSTGAGSGLTLLPLAMNRVLGTKFKIIMGYKSSEELNLALDRGEVQARAFGYASIVSQHADWLANKKVRFIAQIGAKRLHDLSEIPLVTELATTDEQRGILKLISSPPGLGQPYLAPPGTPADRLTILRRAFADTMKDPAFLKEAAGLKLDVDPINAEEITQMILEIMRTPPEIASRTRALLNEADGSSR